jgi:hypothetical protein
MITTLLSTNFSSDSLNAAVVAQTSTDNTSGATKFEGFGTQSTVPASGFWGWLGYRVHTTSTMDQQQVLFRQLKSEIREKYLGAATADFGIATDARRLNAEINDAEATGSFRGSDKKSVSASVVKLAAMERIEAEIDQLSSRKGAFVTPRMIAELKAKAEVQFASIEMGALQDYRPQSTGGRVSDAQDFNPLKDYKSLLKRSANGSEVIRFTTDIDNSHKAGHDPIDREASAPRLTLATWKSAPGNEDVAQKTLAHCLASLKHAYFRTATGDVQISTKEVAFDREVSKYVESRMIDKATGRLTDLTQGDFQVLEKLAFASRSTMNRMERPFEEMFRDFSGTAVPSRYCGYMVEKDIGVIHLINQGPRHAAMYIETLDPEKNAWVLNKVDIGYTADEYDKKNPLQKAGDELIVPGYLMIAEGTVTHRADGQENAYAISNSEVISQADRNIGASVSTRALGFMKEGKMEDVTSMRLPMSDVKRILQAAKAQLKDEKDQLQGNVPLYHYAGRNFSTHDLIKQLVSYDHKQNAAMLELVRIEMLLDHFAELKPTSSPAAALAGNATEALRSTAAEAPTGSEVDADAQNTPSGLTTPELLQLLRAEGLLGSLSLESQKSLPEDTVKSIVDRLHAVHNAYVVSQDAGTIRDGMERRLKQKSKDFEQSVKALLDSPSVSSQERLVLQKLSKSGIERVLSELWQNHRAIHQLSQKYHNLLSIESLVGNLKAARKELEMRKATRALFSERLRGPSEKMAAAMQALRPDGWTKPITAEALRDYGANRTFKQVFEEFTQAAVDAQQVEIVAQELGIDRLLTSIREKAARFTAADVSSALAEEDFTPLADRLHELKPQGWTTTLNASQLRVEFLTEPNRFNRYVAELIIKQLSAEQSKSSSENAAKIVSDRLDSAYLVFERAFKAWREPAAKTLTQNLDDGLTPDRKTLRDPDPVQSLAQNADEQVTEMEKAVAALERRYDELSADMIKGADGYTATDVKGRRAVRAGNCADWVRNMMRLGGVHIEGIELVSRSGFIPDRFNPQDPVVLARGRYDSFRFGFARSGFKLHEKPSPSVRDISPDARTALRNRDDYQIQARRQGAQYDLIHAR